MRLPRARPIRQTSGMDLRPYAAADRGACLAVFDTNAPGAFDLAERPKFAAFLEGLTNPYVVMEHDGAVVGCGGYRIDAEHKMALLRWGMIRRDVQKMGLGRLLLLYRIREISKAASAERVRLATAPPAARFFEKQGFKIVEVVKDGYAPGLDRVEMQMKLAVCP